MTAQGNASLHHTAFVVRAGPQHVKYGDPYTFACSGVLHGDGVIELIAAVGQPSPSMWRFVMQAIANGIPEAKVVRFERHDHDGRVRRREVKLDRHRRDSVTNATNVTKG